MKARRAIIGIDALKELLNLPEDYQIVDVSLNGPGDRCHLVFECERFEDVRGTVIRRPSIVSLDIEEITPSGKSKKMIWEVTTDPKTEPAQPARAEGSE